MAAPENKMPTLEKVPALDDDLDDLDDVLDQFNQPCSPAGPRAPPPTATATTTSRPRHNTRVDAPPKSIPSVGGLGETEEANEDELTKAFAEELQKGMESLVQELSGVRPSEGNPGDVDDETVAKFKSAWEAMLVDEMNGMQDLLEVEKEGKQTASTTSQEGANDFQNKIKQAMDKLRESESNLQQGGSKSAGGSQETFEALAASLKGLGLDGDLPADEEFAGMLESMMGQLLSKDILYEPLKELNETFPSYLETHKDLSQGDRRRYESQLSCVRKIVETFEDPDYDDANEVKNSKISSLMTELQGYGSPPSELMGPLPAGMNFGPDGLPDLEGCQTS